MPPTDGGGARFPKPKADADALNAAAGRMRAAAGGFHTSSGGIRTTSARALQAPWGGPSTVGFVSASTNLQTLTRNSGTHVSDAAIATSAYARVVHDVCTGIDALNRRYDTELGQARTAAVNAPAHSTADPYAGFDALEPQLQRQYDALMRQFRAGAKNYVGALASTAGADPGTMIKSAVHPERAALTAVAKCMGPGALGLYYLASGGAGVKGLGGKFGNYYSWISNGMKAKVAGFLGKSKTLDWLFDLKGAAGRYSTTSAEAWSTFLRGSSELSKPMSKLLSVLRIPEGGVDALSSAKGMLGKVFAPATMVTGAVDLVTGGGDKGAHGVATRVMGGVGFLGGAGGTTIMAAEAIGLTVPGVGEVLVGGALIAYGGYALGNYIYKNRQAIWNGMKSVGHTAANVYHDVSNTVSSVTSSVGHAITHPTSILKHIPTPW